MKLTRPIRLSPILFGAAVIAGLVFIVVTVRPRQSPVRGHEKSEGNPAVTNVVSAATAPANAPTTPVPGTPRTTNNSDIVLRPFAVVKETAAHRWTSEDGRDTNIIRRLAHNDLEYQRMVDENARIFRRQLVYRKDTVPMLIERARGTGQRLESFTLPGLDGREIEVEVMETQVNSSMQIGSVSGRVKGRFNSMASVGFSKGYESFNVFSPDDHLYLVGDAREPGELIVKEIDPNQYAPPSGEPDYILTGESASSSNPRPSK